MNFPVLHSTHLIRSCVCRDQRDLPRVFPLPVPPPLAGPVVLVDEVGVVAHLPHVNLIPGAVGDDVVLVP